MEGIAGSLLLVLIFAGGTACKKQTSARTTTALGGLIYIHGNGAGSDWTWGCVALENEVIEELYKAFPSGRQ